jgi:hypothetical protein
MHRTIVAESVGSQPWAIKPARRFQAMAIVVSARCQHVVFAIHDVYEPNCFKEELKCNSYFKDFHSSNKMSSTFFYQSFKY